MLKNFSNLGTVLNKTEQQAVNGGNEKHLHFECSDGTQFGYIGGGNAAIESACSSHDGVSNWYWA